jgi:hypothetical protein
VNTTRDTKAPKHTVKRLGYGRREAAELLGISAVSVDRLVQRGLLKPSRALRRPLFSEEELLRFLKDTTE